MSLLARIRRLIAPTEDSVSDDAQQAERRRGRRGRRGGRGRSRGEPTAGQANGTQSTAVARAERAAPAPTERAGRGRRDDRGDRNSGTSWRKPRYLLDAPLPEDVAFRPPAEGGDHSILPGRRRPPPGPRTTSRILVGGSRYVTGFTPPQTPGLPPLPETAEKRDDGAGLAAGGEPADGTTASQFRADVDGVEPSAQRRRRRGRRGGRGRRRGASDSASDSSESQQP